MKVFACVFVVLLATTAPTQAFLGKLSLIGALSGNVGGQGSGYGYGVQGGGNRPVVAVNNGYGYGQSRGGYYGGSYGGFQNGGYSGGYQSDGGQVVRVIKVVVPNEQPQQQFYSGEGYAGGYTSGWTPVPAPASAPVPVPYSAPQAVQVSLQSQSAQSDAVVSPPRPIVGPVQSVQIPQPIPVLQPLPVQQSFPQPQQFVKTIKLIVDGDSNQGGGFAAYGPPLQGNYGAYKQGGVYQKVGC